jgi:hypothetical protein
LHSTSNNAFAPGIDSIDIYSARNITGHDIIAAHAKRQESRPDLRLFLDGEELLSLSVEYPYGEAYFEDERGECAKCGCDTLCSGSDQKSLIHLPYKFSLDRPTVEWTEETVLASADIPCDEKSEIIEYIQSTACVRKTKQVILSDGSPIFPKEDLFVSDGEGSVVTDMWKEELSEVCGCNIFC